MNKLIEAFRRAADDYARIAVIADIAEERRASVLGSFKLDPSGKSLPTLDRSAAKFLAQVVRDSRQSNDVRFGAYCILYEVTGRDVTRIGSPVHFNVPDDFDETFLDECSR
jgi:hypothetical protein